MKAKDSSLFTYQQVANLLCEACALNVPSILNGDTGRFYHALNGEHIHCLASSWRTHPAHQKEEEIPS